MGLLGMQAFNAWQSPNILAHNWRGGGAPPWGEFNGIGFKSGDQAIRQPPPERS